MENSRQQQIHHHLVSWEFIRMSIKSVGIPREINFRNRRKSERKERERKKKERKKGKERKRKDKRKKKVKNKEKERTKKISIFSTKKKKKKSFSCAMPLAYLTKLIAAAKTNKVPSFLFCIFFRK